MHLVGVQLGPIKRDTKARIIWSNCELLVQPDLLADGFRSTGGDGRHRHDGDVEDRVRRRGVLIIRRPKVEHGFGRHAELRHDAGLRCVAIASRAC